MGPRRGGVVVDAAWWGSVLPGISAADVVRRATTSVPHLGFPELFVHDARHALQASGQAELGIRGRAHGLALLAEACGVAVLLIASKRRIREATTTTGGDYPESVLTDETSQTHAL